MSRPLSVALDALPLLGQRSGIGAFTAGALEGLLDLGDAVEVSAYAVTWRSRSRLRPLLPDGVELSSWPIPARLAHAAWRFSDRPRFEWFARPVDIVHGTNYTVPPTTSAGRVVTVFDLTPLHFPELCDRATLGYPRQIAAALDAGAYVHTAATSIAEEVIEAFRVPAERVVVVACGIPGATTGRGLPDLRATELPDSNVPARGAVAPGLAARGGTRGGVPGECVRERDPRDSGRRYLLAISTIEPRKDYPSLLAAFAELAPVYPELDLVVVGRKGWGTQAFEDGLGRAGPAVARRVRWLGYVEDARRESLLGGAAVFVYPSIYEGFGFPPLEAMRAGVPVVATTAGSLPEVLGDAALLVPARDPGELARAISSLLDSEELCRVQIAKGFERASRYTWSACAAGLLQLYRDVVNVMSS